MNALQALYHHRSSIGLYGNHIDVQTGRWTAQDSGIGAGVDSYLEYLVKGSMLVQRPELMAIFNEGRIAIDKHLRRNDWYLWVSMHKGQVTLPVFQSLEAYWPGVLSLIGWCFSLYSSTSYIRPSRYWTIVATLKKLNSLRSNKTPFPRL